MEMKQKNVVVFEKKKSRWPTQKNWDFQKIFAKISHIGPWVGRIDWCKGHWCGLTYMAVRLSDISSKTGKKCIFCVFRPFLSLCRRASRPYWLSQINALSINQSYQPKDPSHSIWQKNVENWLFGKMRFF